MKKRLVPIAVVACLAFFFWSAYKAFTEVESGEHVARVSWLPESATDVSFYRSYSFTAYEFTIPEQNFLHWAKGWEVARIVGEPRSISRYHRGLNDVPYPDDPAPGEHSKEVWSKYETALAQYREANVKHIANGYYYEIRQSDGGGMAVGYDKEIGRAYFQSAPR